MFAGIGDELREDELNVVIGTDLCSCPRSDIRETIGVIGDEAERGRFT